VARRHAGTGVLGGLIVLVAVLAAASAAGWGTRLRNGRFRERRSVRAGSDQGSGAAGSVLTEADLGASLGARATLVQFSTEFCAYCGPTRELLAEVARSRDGVALVEIDASRRMDLARRLNVFSTPTVFVLAPDGSIARRASGQPRKAEVLAAVSSVLDSAALGRE
jgi:thioredoxin-like negative regulator of GroEL